MSTSDLLKRPSAFVPIALSLAALTVVALHVLLVSAAPEPDEGAAAHLWQLLMAAQIPIVATFMIRWLPKVPRSALPVLGLQLAAAVAAVAPVYYLGL